jgi:uncharacterized membrane protein YcaP (DUF421 family)
MFFGDYPLLFLLEVLFRTAFMYLYMLLASRFLGKRGVGQLTPFEFIIVIVLGSAAGDPMFYPQVSLLQGVAVITVVVLLEKVIAELSQRNKKLEHIIQSTPQLLVKNGQVLDKALNESGLTKQELLMQLRTENIRDIGEVEYAYLEPMGKLSVFKLEGGKEKKVETTLPQ